MQSSRPQSTPSRGTCEEVVLRHLDAGYRLARWLTRHEHDAQQVVQAASLRALQDFATYPGGDGRAWFLRIVRHTCRDRSERALHSSSGSCNQSPPGRVQRACDPETLVPGTGDASLIEHALRRLPDHFRTLLVLREFEGLSYDELADVIGVPVGTVMSEMSRARRAFCYALTNAAHPREQEVAAAPV